MSTNCLVTKLKGVVDNDTLDELGVLKFNSVETDNPAASYFNVAVGDTVSVKGGSIDQTKTGTEGSQGMAIIIPSGIQTYRIINKYGLYGLDLRGYIGLDISGLSYCNKLTMFSDINSGEKTTGDISVFSKNTVIQNIGVNNTHVYGNVKDLVRCTSLNRLNIGYSRITGKVEELCSGLYNNGKVSGTLVLIPDNTNVTLNENTLPYGNYNITFSNSGCEISYSDNVVASYDGSSWTYA